MKPPYPAPVMVMTRRVTAVVLSLFLACWSGAINLPPAAYAVGFDTGTRAEGSSINADCTDSGILVAVSKANKELGKCPLKHTDVKASVSGYVARVSVRQQFHNPYKEKIEAVYTFPLPADAAVDEMTMKVGNRVIKGSIKKREEARQIYDAAKARGNVASLLDQERPNIFTQSVANIEPGENIDIEISYVNLLKYEDGAFSFVFPTVVGPRFIPGRVTEGKTGTGTAPNTDMVPDASKITPPMAPEGERAGHDISIDLNINAGVPIQSVSSKLHEVDIQRPGANVAHINLKAKDKIPNKDFIATWNVAQDSVQSGYLTHRQGNDGFFTLMLIPPKRVTPKTVQPKEMVFVIDCSGSQNGLPIKKAKETMEYILNHMNPNDTFQIITFNNRVEKFPAESPQVASASMKEQALAFIHKLDAQGGTWMGPAVEAACASPNPDHRLRIITFMTDGYVGNDMEIIGMIKKYREKSRWFSFGTGNSVNRFLIDNIAKAGGGEAEYVLLNSSAEEVGKKFYDRISSPVLTDLKVEFKGVETKEVFPKDLTDLWAQKPLYFTGRYMKEGNGKVILTGYSAGKPYKQEMDLVFPSTQDANAVLPSIWARAKVERLMSEDWKGMQFGSLNSEIREEIVETALKYHIMSQFTSFVAVEEDHKTSGGKPKTVPVQVETPQGVHMEQKQQHLLSYGGSSSGPYIAMHGYNLGRPAPVRAGFGSGGGAGAALPSTTMGKFVHMPGDNMYVPSGQTTGLHSALPSARTNSYIAQSGDSIYGDESSMHIATQHYSHYAPGAFVSKAYGGNNAPSGYAAAGGSVRGTLANKLLNHSSENALREIDIAAERKKPNSESEKQNAATQPIDKAAKYDRNLQVVLEKIAKGKYTGKLAEGLLLIRIELSKAPDNALIEKLKNLGLEFVRRGNKFVIGRIEPKDLHEISKLAEVVQIKLD